MQAEWWPLCEFFHPLELYLKFIGPVESFPYSMLIESIGELFSIF